MRRTRKHNQKGGAVAHLDPTLFGYSSGADLQRDMDMFVISAHGQVTRDYQFTVVPPNTYFIFTSHSSEPADANDPAVESYLRTGRDESEEQYYERLYTNLFKPRSQRKGLQLPKSLYIYEPGDLVPNYDLFFHNTTMFLFTHGLYRLPMTKRFDTEERGTYLGRTKPYIKKLLDHKQLSISDISKLSKQNKDFILSTKPSKKPAIDQKLDEILMDTKNYTKTDVYKKVEEICCHKYPGNLLYSDPLKTEFQTALQKPEPVIQLANLLQSIPYDAGKSKRLFFMHYCRVDYKSYSDMKPLMRTASFAGKCPMTKPNDRAFNTFRVAEALCKLPISVKQEIIESKDGRKLIRLLKSVIPPGTVNWLDCIGDLYKQLDERERGELIKDYSGFMLFEDLKWMATNIPALCESLIYSVQKNADNKQAVLTFSIPFFMLAKELPAQTYKFNQEEAKRDVLIKKILTYFKQRGRKSYFFRDHGKLYDIKTSDLERIVNLLESHDFDSVIDEPIEDEDISLTMIEFIQNMFLVYFPEEFTANTEFSYIPYVKNAATNLYFQNLNENTVTKNTVNRNNNNTESVYSEANRVNNANAIVNLPAAPAPAPRRNVPKAAWEENDFVLNLPPAPAPRPNVPKAAWEENDFVLNLPAPRPNVPKAPWEENDFVLNLPPSKQRRTRRLRKRRST